MRREADSPLFSFYERLVALTKLNLLWLLCALPVVTAGAASAALLTGLTAWRRREDCGGGVFFRAFARSFRRATALWLWMLVLGGSLTVDYLLVAALDFPGRTAAVGAILFVFFTLLLTAGMVFPLLSRGGAGGWDTLVSAVLLAWRHLPRLAVVTAANLLPLTLWLLAPGLFLATGFFWLLWGAALLGLCALSVLDPLLPPPPEPDAPSPDGPPQP